MVDLSGKHIHVVGGSRGIGAGAALLAAKLGANVSITYRNEEEAARKLIAEAGGLGRAAAAFKADVRSEAEVDAAVDSAVKELGPLDGVVISAGVFEHQAIAEMTLDFWNRTIGINLTGTMLSLRAAARSMRATKSSGSIVIYTSTAGQSRGGGGGGGASAYCVSKAGQIMFMKCMAKELAPDRIRVNCVAPAWTETDMAAPSLTRLGREKVAQQFPLGRIGRVEDIANATAYLLSDAAEFITGSTITVDGGMVMAG